MVEEANMSLYSQFAHSYHNLLDKILEKTLEKAIPSFDYVSKNNHLVMKTIKEDLLAYGTYILKYNKDEVEYIFVEDIMKRGSDALNELEMWIKLWFSKWLERTKIVGSKEAATYYTALDNYHVQTKKLMISTMLEAKLNDVAAETLVNEGERACINILSRDLVLYALAKEHAGVESIKTRDDELALMKVVIRRCREVAHQKGVLVFIKVK